MNFDAITQIPAPLNFIIGKNTKSERKNIRSNRKDIYQQVINKIISDLEKGVRPWMNLWGAEDIARKVTCSFPLDTVQQVEHADQFFSDTGANIRHGGGGSCSYYASNLDYIKIPPLDDP